jgi:GTP cyclohydrolase II
MFAKQQVVCDLNNVTEKYNAQLQKGKEIGLEETVCEGQKRTHMTLKARRPVHATVPKHSVDPKCIPKHFIDAVCETSVHDVLTPQQFKTPSPLYHRLHRRSVTKEAIKKDRCRTRRQSSKAPLV